MNLGNTTICYPQGRSLPVLGSFISVILSGRFSNENEEDINPIPVNESTVFSKEDLDPVTRIKSMDYDMDRPFASAPMRSNLQRTDNPVTLMPDSVVD